MIAQIQTYYNPIFGEIRTTGTPDAPLFCLVDVCKALELNNPSQVKSRLNPRGVQLIDLHDLSEKEGVIINRLGNTSMNFINESNLYKCIFQSRTESAERFQEWVTGEVIPSIRKHGAYATQATIDSIIADPENGIRLLQALKDEREQRKLAEKKVEQLEMVAREQTPKVVFADAIVGSQSSCLIGELAKILTQNGYKIGQNRLFEWLRNHHFLGTIGEYYNMPNQRYVEQGLFEIKKSSHSENGVMKTTATPKVTAKGQAYFVNYFLKGEKTLFGIEITE